MTTSFTPKDLDTFLNDTKAVVEPPKPKSPLSAIKGVAFGDHARRPGPPKTQVTGPSLDDLFKVAPTPPPPPAPTYAVEIEVTNIKTRMDRGFIDPENTSVTICIPPGGSVESVNNDKVHAYATEGRLQFALRGVVDVQFDPTEQITCRHYTPNRTLVEDSNGIVADDYGYDRPRKERNTCSHPVMTAIDPDTIPSCVVEKCMLKCEFYEPQEGKIVQSCEGTKTDGTPVSVVLKSGRQGLGLLRLEVFVDDQLVASQSQYDGNDFETEALAKYGAEITRLEIQDPVHKTAEDYVEEIEYPNTFFGKLLGDLV